MIEQRRIRYLEFAANSAKAQIASRKDQRPDAGRDDCPRAHDARLQGAVESRVFQPVIAYGQSGLAEREHFGVRGGVEQSDGGIASLPDYLAVDHNYASDGHLAARLGFARQVERAPHPLFMLG